MKTKVLLANFLSLLLITSSLPVTINASSVDHENPANSSVEYLENGAYIETVVIETAPLTRAAYSTKNGQKTVTYKNSDGVAQWSYTVNGSFSYNGTTSSCTQVSDSYSISDSRWQVRNHSCSKSGNNANGSITVDRKVLGITTQTHSENITLSCDNNGNLS